MKSFKMWVLILLSLHLFGCASAMHKRLAQNASVGTSTDQVRGSLGDPEAFRPSDKEKGEFWTYRGGGDVCEIEFLNNAVSRTSCMKDPNYRGSPLAQILQGMGKGLQSSAHSQQTNCTSQVIGSMVTTNCQ